MKYKYIIFVVSVFLISSCAVNPAGTLKMPLNGGFLESKKATAYKRRPAYNDQYITLAKKNIMSNNYEKEQKDDVFDYLDAASSNVTMYKRMLQDEIEQNRTGAHGEMTAQQLHTQQMNRNSRVTTNTSPTKPAQQHTNQQEDLAAEVMNLKRTIQQMQDEKNNHMKQHTNKVTKSNNTTKNTTTTHIEPHKTNTTPNTQSTIAFNNAPHASVTTLSHATNDASKVITNSNNNITHTKKAKSKPKKITLDPAIVDEILDEKSE